jgi:hypothetical protein
MYRLRTFLFLFDTLSIVVWLLVLVEFFTHQEFHVPTALSTLYVTLVATYVGDKEISRLRKHFSSKNLKGELFVLLWLVTLIGLTCVMTFAPATNPYHLPEDLPIITGTVLCLYLITEYVKHVKPSKRGASHGD